MEKYFKQTHEKITEANGLIEQARTLYKQGEEQAAEALFRKSLKRIREAYLLAESNPRLRRELHRIGRTVHDTFGCSLEFREGTYWINCPVFMSHINVGFSVGGSAKVACSICGQDLLECEHDKGKVYDNIRATKWHGRCNICFEESCSHRQGEVYDGVEAIGIVTEMNLDHVALVTNPSNPLCVIESRSVSESELLQTLPKQELESFVYGETELKCHHCCMCNGEDSDESELPTEPPANDKSRRSADPRDLGEKKKANMGNPLSLESQQLKVKSRIL